MIDKINIKIFDVRILKKKYILYLLIIVIRNFHCNFCDLQADELPPEQIAGMYLNSKQLVNSYQSSE